MAIHPALAALVSMVALGAAAAPPKVDPKKTVNAAFSPAPLPAGEKVAWQHSPFASGDCSICHERNDRKSPGKVTVAGNALCFECHDEFATILKARHKHAPAVARCIGCHNPHDAKERKLLHVELSGLCVACHPGIRDVAERSVVKHDALSQGRKCLSCHNPHASNVENLLTALPFDQCVGCHSQDGLRDDRGALLTNFAKLLEANKVHHAPVESKDCSACHEVHGGDHFRMLVADYPARFYAPYEPQQYALCFGCHNDKVASDPKTTTLTNFRDGDRNLHFLHVNKADRGRTCRACHEVHASPNAHQIREAVPYGPKGWMLKVGFEQTATGGQCARTCHDTKPYVNKVLSSSSAKR